MLVDDFLPVYDVSDSLSTVVHADVQATWDALMQVDLIEVGRKRPLVGMLGALRMLPEIVSHWLHGESMPNAPAASRTHASHDASLSARWARWRARRRRSGTRMRSRP